jgi:uncharacterized membrane protein YphA (DoxX/SURF4 family)
MQQYISSRPGFGLVKGNYCEASDYACQFSASPFPSDDLSVMIPGVRQSTVHLALRIMIGSVWVFHGLYSKLLNGIPRHRLIVARILGEPAAEVATIAIGVMELLLGLWVMLHRWPRWCAVVQTAAILAMNTLEIHRVALNLGFLALGWYSATRQGVEPIHPA